MPRHISIVTLALPMLLISIVSAQPAEAPAAKIVVDGVDEKGILRVHVDKYQTVRTSAPVRRVTMADPDIAEISMRSATEMRVTGRRAGSTRLTIWNDANESAVLTVEVTGVSTRGVPHPWNNLTAVQRSDIPGFIRFTGNGINAHVAVSQIVAVIGSRSTTQPAERGTRIILADGGSDPLPRSIEIPSKLMKEEDVVQLIKSVK